MGDAQAIVTKRHRISKIWIVPIVALVLGVWMVVYTWASQGPEISIVFSTAEGIEAGKTKVRARSVEVGLVTGVVLAEDLEHVVVTASLERSATPLLREGSQLWVVRPRIGAGGISGLGTLVSGGYIELAPGDGPLGRREFTGLEDVPVTPAGTPGLTLSLVSEGSGSVKSGDPILYKGFRVGRVERTEFDIDEHRVRYRAFIEAPYDGLVTSSSRFWDSSGLSFSATADGIRVHTGSLQSLLVGGVAFDLPDAALPGAPVESGAEFVLYPDRPSVNERPYRHALEYVVEFDRSVRGLRPGAPVEYRGIRAGTVIRVLLKEMVEMPTEGDGNAIAVLIRLEPGRLEMGDSPEGARRLSDALAKAADNGLRASLATGNLLTGSLYVSLDRHLDAEPAAIGSFAEYSTLPTISTGLEQIEQQISRILAKLDAAPIEDVVTSADATLRELRDLLASDGVKSLPRSLDATLAELQQAVAQIGPESALLERVSRTLGELERTLQGVQRLSRTLEQKPNALIFSSDPVPDPEPSAGAP